MSTYIGLASHVTGNIGHTMMAVGMEEIVKDFLSSDTAITHFEQHTPFVIYPQYHPLRIIDKIPHGKIKKIRRFLNKKNVFELLRHQMSNLSFLKFVIACGGPNIVPDISTSPEMGLMCHHLLAGFASQGVPVFDFGVGSCYPLERIPEQIENKTDISFYKRYFSYCAVNTVRDKLAEKLWMKIGNDTPLIPCAAIATGRRFEKFRNKYSVDDSQKYIAINFQSKGANDDWGQGVETDHWKKTVQTLIEHIKKRHRVAFLCHNELEYELAKDADISVPRFYPKNFDEFAEAIWQFKAALVSRIHAAIPLAGIGVPSIVVGTDSRLGAVELIGLKTFFVKKVHHDLLEDNLEMLLTKRKEEKARLLSIREDTIARYTALLRKHIDLN